MAIPYNNTMLSWARYLTSSEEIHPIDNAPASPVECDIRITKILKEIALNATKEPFQRSIQFIRDAARLVLKVPIRAIRTPIILRKNWKAREHAAINAKLTGYAFVHLALAPVKLGVALAALVVSARSFDAANRLLWKSNGWSLHLDARASQLEALKEEGLQNAETREEYENYKAWIYTIPPQFCRR